MQEKKNYPPLTKEEEDALIMRAVRGEAGAMAEMHARYRGLIVNESRISYLRSAALAADAENIAVLAFIEALHDYDLLVRELLCSVMHRLTDREKEILSLHYCRDLTLRRIAALLGTSASAVSKSKANLLRKLREGAGVATLCEI